MNENAVLYALSTLAQTCAALAAFVGAVGLFRLQALRDGRRSAKDNLHTSIAGTGLTALDAQIMPTADVLKHIDKLRANPATVGAGGKERIERALVAWKGFHPRVRNSAIALSVFEAWNLLVILGSLGGFAHVPALVRWSWTTWAVWVIAIVTAVTTGASVFVWLERE